MMKPLLTLFTYDPRSIIKMDSALFYWSQSPSLSLLCCSCHFSSCYFYTHLHHSADGFHGRWWDYKSVATPSDYHHRDQLSTHSSTLNTSNVLIWNDTQLQRNEQWMSSSSSLQFASMWWECAWVCELWPTKAVMEFLSWCEVLALFEVPSAMKMSSMI